MPHPRVAVAGAGRSRKAGVYVAIALVFVLTTRLAACVALFLCLIICARKAPFRGDRGSINRTLFSRSLLYSAALAAFLASTGYCTSGFRKCRFGERRGKGESRK
jgi:hypothetical protein